MWEFDSSNTFIFILNNCRINMSFDEDDFFSYRLGTSPVGRMPMSLWHAEIYIFGQVHPNGRSSDFVQRAPFFCCHWGRLGVVPNRLNLMPMITTSCIISSRWKSSCHRIFRSRSRYRMSRPSFYGNEILTWSFCWDNLFFSLYGCCRQIPRLLWYQFIGHSMCLSRLCWRWWTD